MKIYFSFDRPLQKNVQLVLLLITLSVASCSKKDSTSSDPFDPSKAIVLKNQAYGTVALQNADIYLPKNRSVSTKTMVLVHGGFWSAGDKADMDTLIPAIQIEDPSVAIVNINYRLADGVPANQHPAQMEDIGKVLDYIDANADSWHIGKKYFLTGVSAGGHLAMLYSYAYDPSHRVKLVATVLGPTNFADAFYIQNNLFQQIVAPYLGKTWNEDSTLHKNASPINYVTSSIAPTFMAYGGSDPLVPVSNPNALKDKLMLLNLPYTYFLYPNESHELSTPAILNIINKLHVFYNTYLL